MGYETYMPEEVFRKHKDTIYRRIRKIFDTSQSVEEYKSRTKQLKKSIDNGRLKSYFEKIRSRFLEYYKKREIERDLRRYNHDRIHDDVRGIFKEASRTGRKGSAFEQGNQKFNTKLIFIAKKN